MSVQIDFEHAGSLMAWRAHNRRSGATMTAALALPHADCMRWAGSAAFALAAHAGIAAAFLMAPPPNVVAAPPPAAMDVDLVAPPSSSEAVSSATPVGPDQVQAEAQPEQAQEQVETPKFDPPPLERIQIPDAVVLQKIDPKPNLPRPKLAQVAERTTARPTNIAKQSNVAAAPRSGAPSAMPSDAEQSWEQQILARLEREKRYPAEAQQQNLEDFITVRFVLDRRGKVLSARIVHSNGYGPLDAEALAVFRRVTIAPPPEEAKGETFDRMVRLHFFAPRRS
jgi:periplasmic protein TonB